MNQKEREYSFDFYSLNLRWAYQYIYNHERDGEEQREENKKEDQKQFQCGFSLHDPMTIQCMGILKGQI